MLKIFFFISFIYLACCAFLYVNQRDYLYFPRPESINKTHQSFLLESDNEKVKIWTINPGNDSAIIYFGGNGEAVENNLETFARIYPTHTLYLMNYRGYGGSSGSPSEPALYTDAVNIYDHIVAQHTDISLIGRSLGSGIATYLASQRNHNKLILITPYDRMVNIAKDKFSFFPVSLLLKDKYPSVDYVSSIKADTLIMIAEFDEIIQRNRTDNLVNEFKKRDAEYHLQTSVISNVSHNSISAVPEFEKLLVNFMATDRAP